MDGWIYYIIWEKGNVTGNLENDVFCFDDTWWDLLNADSYTWYMMEREKVFEGALLLEHDSW